MNHDEIITLDGYEVAAIPGEGVYIVREDGRCWCVGGVPHSDDPNNELAQAYLESVGGSDGAE
jgi:hypothetical protein